MIVVDTSVLVYAVGADHPLRDPCRRIVDVVAAGALVATTTAEVIQEFTHVRARRRSRRDAASIARDYVHMLSPLLPLSPATLVRGLDVFENSSALGPFDAVLAAAALDAGAEALVSADTGFSTVAGLHHVVPGTTALEQLLGRP